MTSKLLPTPDANMGARGAAKQHKGHRASGAVQQKKLNDLTALISSQEASPASLFPKQEPDEVRKIVATSGLKCYESYESFIRGGLLVKMFAASLLGARVWYSNKSTLTWKAKVTKYSRLLFQLYPSTPRTGEIESGLLGTPRVVEAARLERFARGRIPTMTEAIAMLPTRKGQIGHSTGLKLQPTFVEWMMGYPEGWTEIPDSKLLEMRLSRKSQQK